MRLIEASKNTTYLIKEIVAEDNIKDFLHTLGCIDDEEITLVSKISSNLIINVKDSRYAIDENIAKCILLYD